jgi:hypothetical protein
MRQNYPKFDEAEFMKKGSVSDISEAGDEDSLALF